MRSWVSSAPPKIGRMSQSSRASKPSKSCEHNCRNTIEHNCRTVPSFENSPLFWSIGYFWSTPGKHLHHRSTDAWWLQFLIYIIMRKWKPGRSKAWRSFCLHLSVGGRAMSALSRDPPESNFIFYWSRRPRWKESDHWAQIGKSQVNWDLNPSFKSNIIWAWIICFKNRFTCSSQWPLWHSDCVWILNYRQESKPKSKVA